MMRRTFSREVKLEACRRAESGLETKSGICRELALSPNTLENWLKQYRAKGDEAFDGAPRICEALNKEGIPCGRKKVRLSMKRLSLTQKPKRKRVRTTFPAQVAEANIAQNTAVRRTGELLGADITYIRAGNKTAYLAVVMDAFSRRIIGHSLQTRLDTSLCKAALALAVSSRMLRCLNWSSC